jgi:hypothetical protein
MAHADDPAGLDRSSCGKHMVVAPAETAWQLLDILDPNRKDGPLNLGHMDRREMVPYSTDCPVHGR